MQSTIDTVRVSRKDIVAEAIEEVRREHLKRRLALLDRYLGEIEVPLKVGGVLSFILFWVIGFAAPFVVLAGYIGMYLPICAMARASAERGLGRKKRHGMAASLVSFVAMLAGLGVMLSPMHVHARLVSLMVAGLVWFASVVTAAVRGEWSR